MYIRLTNLLRNMKKIFVALMFGMISNAQFEVYAEDTSSPTYRYVIDVSTSTENGVTTTITTYYYPNLGKTTKDVKKNYVGGAIQHSQENHYNNTSESNYQSWASYSALGLYEEISASDANQYGYDEVIMYKPYYSEDGYRRYFRKVRYGAKLFDITLGEPISRRFFELRKTRYFIKFDSNSLSQNDYGKLDWKGNYGTFYKK